MRKVLALLLLAGVAAPALAAGDRPGRHQESGTQAASEDRGDRSGRQHVDRGNRGNDSGATQSQSQSSGGNSDRPHFVARPDRGGGNDQPPPVTPVESSGGGGGDRHQPVTRIETSNGGQSGDRRFHNGFRGRMTGGEQPTIQPTGGDSRADDTVRNWHGPKIVEPVTTDSTPTLRQPDRRLPRVFRDRVPIVSNAPREGTQPPVRTESRRTNWANWSTSHWRNDKRYDWKDHRRRHRSLFHFSFYSDPFGWSYRPYQIGWRLWPSYYSSSFWLNDPWQYRLPYAPPGYRWIRYYDDAILVDTWDGRVVDVIYNFFW